MRKAKPNRHDRLAHLHSTIQRWNCSQWLTFLCFSINSAAPKRGPTDMTAKKIKKASNKPKKSKKTKEEVVAQAAPDDVDGEGVENEDGEVIDGENSGGDPILDRRIIEGMLRDKKALLTELAKEGITPAQVMRRAADLGLSEAYIRQVQGVAADLAGERPGSKKLPSALGARTCLSCERVFLSSGPGNRLCMRCRGGDAGLAQL